MSAPAVRVRGLRHLPLKVRDVRAAARFYSETFAMRVVWEPDADNVYLSSGSDSLDGSLSCSCRDPEGNLVQIIFLPGTEE